MLLHESTASIMLLKLTYHNNIGTLYLFISDLFAAQIIGSAKELVVLL